MLVICVLMVLASDPVPNTVCAGTTVSLVTGMTTVGAVAVEATDVLAEASPVCTAVVPDTLLPTTDEGVAEEEATAVPVTDEVLTAAVAVAAVGDAACVTVRTGELFKLTGPGAFGTEPAVGAGSTEEADWVAIDDVVESSVTDAAGVDATVAGTDATAAMEVVVGTGTDDAELDDAGLESMDELITAVLEACSVEAIDEGASEELEGAVVAAAVVMAVVASVDELVIVTEELVASADEVVASVDEVATSEDEVAPSADEVVATSPGVDASS